MGAVLNADFRFSKASWALVFLDRDLGWGGVLAKILDESPIEVCEAKKPLQLLHRLGVRPLLDDSYLPLVHQDSILAYDVSEKLHHI